MIAALGLWLIAALGGGTVAADPAPAPVPAARESATVTIEAQRHALEQQLDGFVDKITRDPRFHDQSVPRWRMPVCFAVAGLGTREALFVLARLQHVALSAGAHLASRGCQYNFYVVFTPEPDKVLQRAFHHHPGAFDRDQGMPAIRHFLSPGRPQAVRVWHNARAYSPHGVSVGIDSPCASFSLSNRQVPVNCGWDASRVIRDVVFGFSLALVVVDTSFPKAANLGQLADFAAMVGLADVDVDVDLGDVPSILRLFATAADTPPSGLTTWDQAFLRELYHSDQSSPAQRSQIAVRMVHDVAP
jgi:hypothetical protein